MNATNKDTTPIRRGSSQQKAVCSRDPASNFYKPTPAAVVQNFQGSFILYLLRKGLYIYEKEEKEQ
uniref:Uncharacterized protein n=1 Tax=viral metagenome TaxID=1070528 RepID=A0A6H1ZUX9_9ZZZZ